MNNIKMLYALTKWQKMLKNRSLCISCQNWWVHIEGTLVALNISPF